MVTFYMHDLAFLSQVNLKNSNNYIYQVKGEERMFNEYEDIMTVEDVMEALHVGKNRVYELLSEQKLSGFRMGRPWKIPKESVIEYVRKNAGLQK